MWTCNVGECSCTTRRLRVVRGNGVVPLFLCSYQFSFASHPDISSISCYIYSGYRSGSVKFRMLIHLMSTMVKPLLLCELSPVWALLPISSAPNLPFREMKSCISLITKNSDC